MRHSLCLAAGLFSFFAFAAEGQAAIRYTVTDLGYVLEVLGLNDSGHATGAHNFIPDRPHHAFLYDGTMHDLGTLQSHPDHASYGAAINASGQVAGASQLYVVLGEEDETLTYHAFRYDGAMHDLGSLSERGHSSGAAINASGQVTGRSSLTYDGQGFPSHAFRYDGGGMQDLGTLGGTNSNGLGINDSGHVTGNSETFGNAAQHAFLYNGAMHDLGTLGGSFSTGNSINANGQVTGNSNVSGNAARHAFLWTPTAPNGSSGTMQDLDPGALYGYSEGYSINANGDVVGRAFNPNVLQDAFLYIAQTGMVDLNTLIDPLSGWHLHIATAINDAGQIVGNGIHNGEARAFLLSEAREVTWLANHPTSNFDDASNWDLARAPGAADIAIFDEPGVYVVATTLATPAVERLVVRDGDVHLTIGQLSLLSAGDGLIIADSSPTAKLTLDSQTLTLAGDVLIGAANTTGTLELIHNSRIEVDPTGDGRLLVGTVAGATGIMTIAAGSSASAASLHIGNLGRVDLTHGISIGTSPASATAQLDLAKSLEVLDGGKLNSGAAVIDSTIAGAAAGSALISGASSVWAIDSDEPHSLTIGGEGAGVLNVEAGGTVSLTGFGVVVLGDIRDSDGNLTVKGAGSSFSADRVYVGDAGFGRLRVEAGGFASIKELGVGIKPNVLPCDGEVTVTGVGSRLETGPATTIIGQFGKGSLVINSGATAGIFVLKLADQTTAVGDLVVDGLGSKIDASLVIVADNGTATAIVRNGGIINATGLIIGSQSGGRGTLEVTGPNSMIDIQTNLFIGVDSGRANLRIFNGGEARAKFTIVDSNGSIFLNVGTVTTEAMNVDFGGAILGNGTLAITGVGPNGQRMLWNGGFIAPGLSPGLLTIDGNYTQTATGQLEIEIAGTNEGEFDVLAITGEATLDGSLVLKFIDGFAPQAMDNFAFLDIGGTLNGAFSQIEIQNLAPGFQFDIVAGDGGLTLRALNDGVFSPDIPGDQNDDDAVNAADYVLLAINGGTEDEFEIWRANFGNVAMPPAGGSEQGGDSGVPEPAGLVLIMFGLAGLSSGRRVACR